MDRPEKTIIHMVGNAHIDPVWLWKYSDGVTEAISTCHSAANLLDQYSDFIFTRADSWIYEQIEKYDPGLFSRIAEFIRQGRWDTTGGWYLQPDCNFPTEEGFLAHMRIGREYFRSSFDVEVTTAMNVDSFGHTAFLPRLLRESDFDSYVFMRPGINEKELPSELFRWQSPDGFEILTWRIQQSYNADTPSAIESNIEHALEAKVDGIPHVLCYYGVGDHGGGPTAGLIEWIETHKDTYPDVELRFSSPTRFFKELRKDEEAIHSLPVVTGELQYHAVGCYTVLGSFKRALRRAETRVIEASQFEPDQTSEINAMWKPVLLNQFHDTAGGTCIPESYIDAHDQLGQSTTLAESVIADHCYRHLVSLEPSRMQRVVLFNPSPAPFRGPVNHEPWLEWKAFAGDLRDANGNILPYQISQQAAYLGEKRRMTWFAEIPAQGTAEYLLETDRGAPKTIDTAGSSATITRAPGLISVEGTHWNMQTGGNGTELLRFSPADAEIDRIGMDLRVIEDKSDTWSHGITSFDGDTLGKFGVTCCEIEESGPVFTQIRIEAKYHSSLATILVREYKHHAAIGIDICVVWNETFSLAKLCLLVPEKYAKRTDGVPGGYIERPNDGREYPICGWTHMASDDSSIGVASPDCFAYDSGSGVTRLTLLRSAPYAWHQPTKLRPGYPYKFTDTGVHDFRFKIFSKIQPEELDTQTRFLSSPPRIHDWTRGMGGE